MHAKRTAQRILVSGFTRMVSFFAKSVALLAILSFLFISSSSGANYYWITSGDWSVAANWNGTEPTRSDCAWIDFSTASITQPGEICNMLYLDGSGTIEMTAGSLSATYEFVGYTNGGTFIQSGGTNSVSYRLSVGTHTNSTGVYLLSGSGFLTTGSSECIGEGRHRHIYSVWWNPFTFQLSQARLLYRFNRDLYPFRKRCFKDCLRQFVAHRR